MYLNDQGKKEAIKPGGLADSLVLHGFEVVVPDLSGFGELAPGYIKGGDSWIDKAPLNLWYTSLLMNQSLVQVRMHELSFLLDWIAPGSNQIEAVTQGLLSTDLLHIAIMRSNQFSSITLRDPLMSYQSVVTAAHYHTRYLLSAIPGMLGQYDIDDLIRYLSQRTKVSVIRPRNGAGERVQLQTVVSP